MLPGADSRGIEVDAQVVGYTPHVTHKKKFRRAYLGYQIGIVRSILCKIIYANHFFDGTLRKKHSNGEKLSYGYEENHDYDSITISIIPKAGSLKNSYVKWVIS